MKQNKDTEIWFPLSAAQSSRWFLYQLHPGSQGAHNISFAARVHGRIDEVALNDALQELAARHPMLRARFREYEGEPRQSITDSVKFPVLTPDVFAIGERDLAGLISRESLQPFDLGSAPLVRARLYRISAQETVLLLVLDHIILDGWSYWLILEELGDLLAHGGRDPKAGVGDYQPGYFDYIKWQREWLQSEDAEKQFQYWQKLFDRDLPSLQLPTDRPRPGVSTNCQGAIPFSLSESLCLSLRALTRKHGGTLFTTVLAAYQILLHRLSGQEKIVVGAPMPARSRREWDGVVGDFANPIALKADFAGDPSVGEVLRSVRRTALRGMANQDLPFSELVGRLGRAGSNVEHPLFQTMFVLQKARRGGSLLSLWNDEGPSRPVPWGGVELTPFPLQTSRANSMFDLALEVIEVEKYLRCGFKFDRDVFDEGKIERLAGQFETVLRGMVADDGQRVSELSLLDEEERRQVLVEFNATDTAYPQDRCVHELFEEQAAAQPEAVAVVYAGESLSYGELNRRANHVAHYLIGLGIRPDDRVAICVKRSLEMVVGVLGILKAGAAYVPLDPGYPAERLAYMLEDSAPLAMLTQSHLGEQMPPPNVPVLLIDEATVVLTQYPETNPDPRALGLTPGHLAYIIYTSGSTGAPKGVMVPHSGLTNYLHWARESLALQKGDHAIVSSPLAFDAKVTSLYTPLVTGGTVTLLRDGEELEGLESLLRQERSWSLLKITPSLLGVLGRRLQAEGVHCTVRVFVVGGEAVPASTITLWQQICPGARFINHYGPTETVVGSSTYEIPRALAADEGTVPIGRPIANTRIYILDGQLQPVPVGVPGELYIGGAGVARGYLHKPELTAERFVADPYSLERGARMYQTGDLGRWLPDGNIEYLGRNDFQVKIRGFRIEPGEIEAKLLGCVGVREAVVVAREDVPAEQRLVAYIVPQAEATVEAAALRQQLSAVLPEYMVPSAFVTLLALPLTPNGKLDRRGLPAPDITAVATRSYEAPQGEVETTIARIWQELLGLEQVGRHDHFFELGGHSLMVITMLERLRQKGLVADVRTVFANPTLSAIAGVLANSRNIPVHHVPPNLIAADCSAITPEMLPLVRLTQEEIDQIVGSVPGGAGNVQDIYPLAPLQEGILFHHLLEKEGDAYLWRTVLAFDSRHRLEAFLKALQSVVDRHDILRTAIRWSGVSQPVQVVYRHAPLAVEELCFEGDVRAQLLSHSDPRHLRLDLERAPLLAAYMAADRASGEWLLALVNHHMIGDHITLELIFGEIQGLLRGAADQLPAAVPYRNFIAQSQGVPAGAHEAWFRGQLGDIDEPTAPFGVLDVQGGGEEVEEVTILLSEDLAGRIREAARRQGVSAAVLFHVAWAQVLAQCSGREEVVFGTVLTGRLQGGAGADQALGMFINTLPARVSLGGRSVQQVVGETYQRLSELLEHEQASLALAQRCSGVAAPLPLFTTLLNYRHSHVDASQSAALAWEGIRALSSEERTNYPIAVSVDDLGEGFRVVAQCAPGVEARRIADYLRVAVEGIVEALRQGPEQAIAALSILPAEERRQVLVEFNATEAAYPQDRCVHEVFEEQAAAHPEAVAVVYAGESLSYGELNRRANQLAHHLVGLGIRPDDRVAICAERSLEMVVGLLGILKAGGAYVPLDPGYPSERLAYMLQDSSPVALLTQGQNRDLFAGLSEVLPVIDLAELAALCDQPETNPDPASMGLTGEHLAYVIYTSGSTGTPKGVMVTHSNVARLFSATDAWFQFNANDTWTLFHSFAFDFSVWEMWGALLYGGRLIVVAKDMARSPEEFYKLVCREKVTVLNQTPSAFRQLIAAQGKSGEEHQLRQVIFGGEALEVATLKPWYEQNQGHRAQLINMYGITETTVHVTYQPLTEADTDRRGGSPIGRRIPDLRTYILDGHGEPVPVGVTGELYIGGAGVARGYWNRPELAAKRFVRDPFVVDGGRMYKTGDLGKWLADGTIEYLGRNDFQVKIRGFRIELGEIEAKLLGCAGVREAVVVAREDVPGEQRLVAYIVPQAEAAMEAASLRAQLSAALPEYMVPSAFVSLPALPLTPNGKLDRRGLPAPDITAVATRSYEAPQGEVETTIARIWQELLQLDRVGRHDHFFELGGHSLLAVQLISRVRQMLGLDITVRGLFEQPTVAGLAKVVAGARQDSSSPILRADRSQALPLSWAQQRLWFLDQLDHAASAAYHIPAALRMHGHLQVDVLRAALDGVVARHENLRTRFVNSHGQPAQVIAPANAGFPLVQHDLSDLPEPEQHCAVARWSAAEANHPFDLASGPLIRGRLLRLSADQHILLVTQHHIISDGWSIGVLVQEVSALYSALLQGEPDPLPALPIQYADYAVWQRQTLQGETLEQQIGFWRHQLQGAPALLELPTDRPRPGMQSYRGGSVGVRLSAELTRELRQLGQRHGATLFMTLLSGWTALLARWSGQPEVVIGTPVANRQRAEVESLIGFFVNTLALRVGLEEDPSVAELLEQVKGTTLAAYSHQDVPFEQVVEAVQPPRSLSHSPIFQVMLALNNTPRSRGLSLPGLRLEQEPTPHGTTQFDLTLSLTEVGEEITGGLEYASDLFDERTIERLAGQFETILRGMVADERKRVSELPLLREDERRQVLVEFNNTEAEYPQDRCVHELFEEQAAATPQATAVVAGEESMTYAELNRRANQVAHHLLGLGVRPDDRVAICMERGAGLVVGLLGILKAGGAYVPLDPHYPAERLAYLLGDCAPAAVLTEAQWQPRLPADGIPVVLAEVECRGELESNLDAAALGLNRRRLAYVIYTSGSTGAPKGVMVELRNVVNHSWAMRELLQLSGQDRVLQFANAAFDVVGEEVWPSLLAGAAVVVWPGAQGVGEFTGWVEQQGVSVLNLPASFWHAWCGVLLAEGARAGRRMPRVRRLVVGSETVQPETAYRWQRCYGERIPLLNAYGPTEATITTTCGEVSVLQGGERSVAIGRPIANTQVYVLDARRQPVPVGVTGELYIGGAGVARGYLNRPELTAERFVEVAGLGRVYRTGDLGRWLPDGTIEYLGRNDFQVKIRGFRMELGEIEAKLLGCAGVREAVVVAREDVPGEQRLVAYIVPQAEAAMEAASLRAQLSAALPEYMVPSAFVSLPALPLTPNGKLDRRGLPAPDITAVATRSYEAPQGEVETTIARIWQELLQLDRVGRHDHFFELGGHSLLAVQLISRVRQMLGLDITVRGLFEQPTVAGLAKVVAGARQDSSSPILRADRSQALPLSWAQQRLWFLDQLDHAASAAYHIPAALRMHGQLQVDVLRAALDGVVARHENLRTRFVNSHGQPAQVIAPAHAGFPLVQHDLSDLPEPEQHCAVARWSAAEANHPFDLASGPLIRGRLLRLSADQHILLVTQHHIISDGWSIGLLVQEVSALYSALLQGEPDPLPALPIQYADYAVWQRQTLQGETLEQQIGFWRQQLQGAPALLELPTDRARPGMQSYRGGSVGVRLSVELTRELRQLGQRHGATLFMTLLSGWTALLARWSGQPEVVIGTPVANRQRAEVESLIGFFVNTLALRVRLEEDPSVAELLEQVKGTTLAAYSHQDVPFEQVVEAVQPPRSLSHSPIFQVMLALNNTPRSRGLSLPGLRLEQEPTPHGTTQFDLTLSLTEVGEEITGGVEYASDLFDERTIERLAGQFETMLRGMVADEGQRVSELPLLSEEERRQVLVEFNNTEAAYPQDRCVHELFEEQAAAHPEAVAVVYAGESLSYGELNRRANQLAHHLVGLGIRPDDRVAICAERSLEMVVGLLGILKAGGAYVPLDPNYPAERLAYMLQDCAPTALVTQGELRHRLAAAQAPVVLLEAERREEPETNPDPAALGLTPAHLAYVIYTSGSTGQPKGAMNEHGAVVNRLWWTQSEYRLGTEDRILQKTPFSFDVSVWEFFWPLLAGAQLVMARPNGHQDPHYLGAVIEQESITTVHFVPSMLQVFLDQANLGRCRGLRRVLCSGEALPYGLQVRFQQGLPEVELHNLYGPTEAAVDVTYWRCRGEGQAGVVPIGRPVANTQIYILDGRRQPVPVGVTGELYIGGAQVGRGYLNRPEMTAERFVEVEGLGRLYRTGDLGRWLGDGNIEFQGRNDFQVKIRGFRMELGEIEARLLASESIRQAVVVAREDTPGDKHLVAYVVAQEGIELEPAELRAQLSQVLPEYMVPSAFVSLPALPLTPNGKLDRRALPAPDASAVVRREYEPPQGEVETTIAQIWQELLGLEQVGRHDHFFELGGHSLMVITMLERLRQKGLVADVRTVFAHPTLADLAAGLGVPGGSATYEAPPNLIVADCSAITPEMLPLVRLTQEEIDQIVGSVPGGAGNVQDIYPLAPLQEGILFHHLLEKEGDAYLLRAVLAFDSRQRLDAFLKALQAILDRHDILRTAIRWSGVSQPVQVVYRHAPLAVEELSFEGDVRAQLLSHSDPRHLRLDLERAPLLAAYMAADQASGECLLALVNHHMIGDHITLELIFGEIQGLLRGAADQLPAAVPYRNFIAQSQGVPAGAHEAWFRGQLGDIDEPTAPFGVLDVQGGGEQVEEVTILLSEDLAGRIREAARRQGVSAAVLFHVAWAQVLAQCSGREEVVFGTVLTGRLQGGAGADRALGMFINTLPARVSLGGRSVQQVVGETYQRLSELLEHEQASLALAQRCSGVAAPLPLFTTLLNYRHSHVDASQSAALAWEGIRALSSEERTNYPITVSVDDLGEGFRVVAQCAPGVEARRIADYLRVAVEGVVEALRQGPEQAIAALSILPAEERRQVLVEFNATAREYPQDRCVHELFEEQAAAHPEAVAVVYAGESLSYGELNRRANQLAHHLVGLGIRPDDRVAICVERSLEMVVGLLGILKAGGAYVPLDPNYPAERLAYMLEDCAPTALVTQGELRERLGEPQVPVVLLEEDFTAEAESNPDAGALGLTPAHVAYVIYTSGSTGAPKGVLIEHRNTVNLLAWAQAHFSAQQLSRTLFSTSINFDLAVFELFVPLGVGGTVVLAQDALAAGRTGEAITLINTVPSAMKALLEAEEVPDSVAWVNLAGEPLKGALVERMFAGTQVERVANLYGPTETTTYSTWAVMDRGQGFVRHIGRPIANTQVYILDGRRQPVPMGVSGELYIGGAGVARGYLNRPEMTAERFVEVEGLGRLYRTGDLGRWLGDGNIEFQGRNDFQVKIRGFRIELGEIEAKVLGCAGVREAVVVAREDVAGEQRLVAYIVPQAEAAVEAAALRAQLSAVLPEYMVPSAFVSLPALPLTPNGKLDRRALPAPDLTAVATRGYEPPQGEVEIAIAQIWQDLLGLEQVGRHDQFFELGGHSLLAVRLVSRLRQLLGVEITLRDVFAQPTLAGLAQLAGGAVGTSSAVPIGRADRSQPLPLSWAQQRLWFLDQLDQAAGAAYHMVAALRLSGALDRSVLRASLDRMVERHEILRTRFVSVEGQPRQVIVPAGTGFALEEHDVRGLGEDEQHRAVAQWSEAEANHPFDLASGPLIRGRLLRLSADQHILLVTQHHIISDGWSIGLLVQEVSALYSALLQGEPDPLPALPIQYADYAVWQRQMLQGETLKQQIGFWRQHLQGAPALLELPTDRARPGMQSYRGGSVGVRLSAELTRELRQLGQRHGATLFMTLLSGWTALLARWSGQPEVVIGTPVANRQRAEVESLIGFFVNTLALRVGLEEDPSVAELLEQVKGTTLAAYSHQDVPFEQVVEAVQPPRSLSHSPIFQVMLALNNTPRSRGLSLPGLRLEQEPTPHGTTQFDLTLSLTEVGEEISGGLEYASDLFDERTIERLAGQLETVLRGMVADEGQRVSELPLLSEEERRQVLVEFNNTEAAYPQDRCVHELFEEQAAATPGAIAVVSGGESLTYAELNGRANQVARHLLQLGIRPEDHVAICMERGAGLVAGLLGILKAGGAYVPLDPNYPSERLAYMLEDCAPAAVLTEAKWHGRLPADGIPVLAEADCRGEAESNLDAAALRLSPAHLAYVIYTSGSTGTPKGVMVEHGSVVNHAWAMRQRLQLSGQDRVLQFANAAFDVFGEEVWPSLLAGAAVVVLPGAAAQSLREFTRWVEQQGVSVLNLPASFWHAWCGVLLAEGAEAGRRMARVQRLVVGSETVQPETVYRWQQCFGERIPLLNAYGPTEATITTTCGEVGVLQGGERSVAIGRPIANAQVYALDREGEPVPVGVAGELYVGGAGVARGYLNRPELTAERFVEVEGLGRVYKTGDLGRWLADGTLEHLGRNDSQVKLRGFRIELGEIEARLAECAGVSQAVVVLREDTPGEKRLVAYVVPQSDSMVRAEEVRRQLAALLPEYMVPAAYVSLKALPVTGNGKVDRQALPMPDGAALTRRAYEEPHGELEGTIAQIWRNLLGVEQVGREDHFFQLGGHSLLVISLIDRLRQKGIGADVRTVFANPTLAAMAAAVSSDNRFPAFVPPPNLIPADFGQLLSGNNAAIEELRL